MKKQKLTAQEIDKFFSKERPVFVRNVCDMLVSLSLQDPDFSEGKKGLHILIPKEPGWKRLDAPFDVIKQSSDLKKFLLKEDPPLQLWLGKKPPKGYKLLIENCAYEVVGLPEVEKLEMPPVDPDVVNPSPGREAFEILTFNKVFEAFSEERGVLVTQLEFHRAQIEFHRRSLEAAEGKFSEVDSVYGVLKWLRENVFDEESKRQLIRNALCGEAQPAPGEVVDYTLPRTYSALKEWVSAISSNGKYANLQERFRAYNDGFRHGRTADGSKEVGLHVKDPEAAPKAAHALRSVKKKVEKVEKGEK